MTMKKSDYLGRLRDELQKKKIPDVDDIVSEYEQHFAFRLADGHTEEEIAAKLEAPEAIAAQFGTEKSEKSPKSAGGFLLYAGLTFAALLEAMLYILFFAWVIVLGAASVAFAAIGGCLIVNTNVAGLIPAMPYSGALILGISILALAVVSAVGTVYCFAYTKQLIKASMRWHRNMTASSPLPPLPVNPQFSVKIKRTLRTVILSATMVCGVTFVVAYTVLALQAGALGFWHVWHWFV
ncbi:MAG: DUF1700 domain-containing protein [Clostridia bacterium]|nr:DUF1700 domain-containing protein [Clostridia bacterium]